MLLRLYIISPTYYTLVILLKHCSSITIDKYLSCICIVSEILL